MKLHPYITHNFSVNKEGELITILEGKENKVFGFKIIIVRYVKYVVPIPDLSQKKNIN